MRLAINKVRKSLGSNQVAKLIAYTALEQEHQWEQLGVTISQIIKEGAGGRASDLDLLFTGEKSMAGVPIKSSINANQTRVDFLDLSHWGRAVMQDIDFYDVGGQTVFPIYGASLNACLRSVGILAAGRKSIERVKRAGGTPALRKPYGH